jgi:hypothetical protein
VGSCLTESTLWNLVRVACAIDLILKRALSRGVRRFHEPQKDPANVTRLGLWRTAPSFARIGGQAAKRPTK